MQTKYFAINKIRQNLIKVYVNFIDSATKEEAIMCTKFLSHYIVNFNLYPKLDWCFSHGVDGSLIKRRCVHSNPITLIGILHSSPGDVNPLTTC